MFVVSPDAGALPVAVHPVQEIHFVMSVSSRVNGEFVMLQATSVSSATS
jgi:hypothetical protein